MPLRERECAPYDTRVDLEGRLTTWSLFAANTLRFETVHVSLSGRFAEGKVLLQKGPSAVIVAAIEGRKPGSALDIGMGQGRNALYLAEKGWEVTGVDLSDVAVDQAKASAAHRGVKLNAVVSDVDAFDFGSERWISSLLSTCTLGIDGQRRKSPNGSTTRSNQGHSSH